METMQTEVRQFVIDNFLFGQEVSPLTNDESFLETGIIDSTGVLELVGFLEARYEISIAEEDLVPANLDSVNNVATFVARKLREAARVAG